MTGFVRLCETFVLLVVVGVLAIEGYQRGFNMAHSFGIVAMLAVHHRDAIAAIIQHEAPQMPPQVQQMISDYENFKKAHTDQIQSLQTELSKTNMVLALKTGLLKSQVPGQGQS